MKLYRVSMRKMGSSSVEDIPAMQDGEGLLHFQWLDRNLNAVEHDRIIFSEEAVFEKVNQALGRVYILKFNTDDQKFFIWMQASTHSRVKFFPSATLVLYLVVWQSSLMKEEPDASTPFQVFEDMLEDNISSRTGNLVVPDLGAEVMSDVGPRDVMIHVAGSSGDPDEGDILKLDLIKPLIETLSLEEGLTSHLPEGHCTPEDILHLLQSPPFRQQMDSFTYVLRTGHVDLSQFRINL